MEVGLTYIVDMGFEHNKVKVLKKATYKDFKKYCVGVPGKSVGVVVKFLEPNGGTDIIYDTPGYSEMYVKLVN